MNLILRIKIDTYSKGVDQMRQILTSRLIKIYIVCHSVINFRLKSLFASVGMSKLNGRIVHFRNSEIEG